MCSTWIISDTHFYHERLHTVFGIRPRDFTERIINNWRRLVKDDDLVYHLGDVAITKRAVLAETMRNLPGKKILIRGNHDRESDGWYLRNGWNEVVKSDIVSVVDENSYVIDVVTLSHKPMPIDQCVGLNIHGHFHNQKIDRIQLVEPEYVALLTPRHYLFAIENVDYSPVLLNKAVGSGLVKRTLVEIGATNE